MISKGKDYCTMFTCTPYGINTHRLLIRGHRVSNLEEKEIRHVVSEALLIEPAVVAPMVALPMLLILFIWLMIPKKKRKWRDEW
jgi:sortase A